MSFVPEGSGRTNSFLINMLPAEDIASLVADSTVGGGNIGIVCNTVRNAISLYDELSLVFDDITLVHSRFVGVDRINNDNVLLERFGKTASGSNGETRIVIGTQVMEQSLDIDFDMMITELAPMDLIMQRIGRCHRHSNKARPEILKQAKLYIIEPDEHLVKSIGSKYIYGEYRLEQTIRTIAPKLGDYIRLPDDIGNLVQSAYDFHEDDMEDIREKEFNRIDALRSSTLPFLIAPTTASRKTPIMGWLEGGLTDDGETASTGKVRNGFSGPSVIAVFTDKNGRYYIPYYKDSVRMNRYLTIDDNIYADEIRRIMGSMVTLPISFGNKIHLLEGKMVEDSSTLRSTWEKSSALKSEIALVFNDENYAQIGDNALLYSIQKGLFEL